MVEAGVVVDWKGEPIFWHEPRASSAYIPDSRSLWDVLWECRDVLRGFAHTHPGSGTPLPSETDLTSFAAVEAGLGQRLLWWVLSSDKAVVCLWLGPKPLDYLVYSLDGMPGWPTPWAAELRRRSRCGGVKEV